MNIICEIALDFAHGTIPITVFAKQNDSKTRFVRITPLENGKPFSLKSGITARLHLTKPDGHVVVNDAMINAESDTITVELTRQTLAAAGKAVAEVGLYKDDALLSSQIFFINIERNAYQNGIPESSDEYKSFLAALVEVDKVSKNANTAATAASTAAEAANEAVASANQAAANANEAAVTANASSETAASALKGVTDLQAFIGYTDEDIVGLQVDYDNNLFKRLAGAYGKTAGEDFDDFLMYGGRKRCNVSDNGTIVAYYGDEDYAEDGSNGQVMVYQPAFWYKVVPLKLDKNTESGIGYHLRKANYYVSETPKPGFRLHPAFYDENGNEIDYILFSAYEGSMYDVSAEEFVNDGTNTDTAIETGDLLCSVAGVKPISGLKKNLTKANLELMAQNRSTGWHLETIKAASANQLLMIIELGTMNTQTGMGQGVITIADNDAYNCSSLTGSTSSLGNATGQAASTVNEIGGVETTYNTAGKVSVTYRGVENPWGNIWKHIQGVNIWGDGTMCGGQPYVASNFIFNEYKQSDNYGGVGFTLPNSDGYIKAMGYGKEEFDWLFMPSAIGGTSALPVGDYHYKTTNLNSYRIALLGGTWSHGGYAGGFDWRCFNGVGVRGRGIGGRLLYVPTAKED